MCKEIWSEGLSSLLANEHLIPLVAIPPDVLDCNVGNLTVIVCTKCHQPVESQARWSSGVEGFTLPVRQVRRKVTEGQRKPLAIVMHGHSAIKFGLEYARIVFERQ